MIAGALGIALNVLGYAAIVATLVLYVLVLLADRPPPPESRRYPGPQGGRW